MKTKTWIAISVIATLLCMIWIEGGHAEAQGAAGAWGGALYAVYPYGPMNRQDPGLCRQDGPIVVALAQGELEAVCLVLDNRKGKDTLDFRVSIRSNARDGRMGFPKDRIRLGRLVYLPVREKSTHRRIHPAKGGREVADAIVPLGVAEPVTVGPKEVRHIWLTLDARGVSPGRYATEVTVRPLTPSADGKKMRSKKVSINIQVWPFVLPEKTPIAVFTWDYGSATHNDEWLRNFSEHRVNTFHVAMDRAFTRVRGLATSMIPAKNFGRLRLKPDGSLESQPDFSSLTDMLLRAKPYGKFFFETYHFRSRDSDKEFGWNCTDGSRIPYLSDRWAIGYKQWLRALKAYLESLGIGTDQWYILTHDEAFHQDGEKGALGCAKLTYEVDPTIQFFMDTLPTRGPEQLEPWRKKDTNTTWCPWYGIYNSDRWHLLKSLNRPMWMYLCHEQQRGFSPHAFYRVRGWLAWIYGLDGIAFWSPIVRFGSGWDDLDGGHGDTCMILVDSDNTIPDMPEEAREYYYLWEHRDRPPPADWDGKPINTRRWEAYREGIEDYLYLYLLDNLLKTKKPDARLAAKARKLMAEACEEFELATKDKDKDNAKTTQAQRKQIAELIVKLNGSVKAKGASFVDEFESYGVGVYKTQADTALTETQRRSLSMDKLRRIGHRVKEYRAFHNDLPPPSLERMGEGYHGLILNPDLISPMSGREKIWINKSFRFVEKGDYVLVPLPKSAPSGLIEIYENPDDYADKSLGEGTIVLSSGSEEVRWVEIEVFKQRLAQTEKWLSDNGFAKEWRKLLSWQANRTESMLNLRWFVKSASRYHTVDESGKDVYGHLPSLKTLLHNGNLRIEHMISPVSGRDLAQARKNRDVLQLSEFSDYVYLSLPDDAPDTLIQAYEKTEHYNDSPWGKGTIVMLKSKEDTGFFRVKLKLIGTTTLPVGWMDIESFQAALERTQKWLAENKK